MTAALDVDDFADVDMDTMPDTEHVTPNFEASQDPPAGFKRIWTPPAAKAKTAREPKLKKAAPRMPTGGLAGPLTDVYTMIGAVLTPIDPVCGQAVMMGAPDCAKALEKLAKSNPEVRRVLVGLVTTSTWGAVITAHIPIIMAIAMHHMPALSDKMNQVAETAEGQFSDPNPDFVRATS